MGVRCSKLSLCSARFSSSGEPAHGMDVRDQTDVALSLSARILTEEANNSNLVFSPLSIHVVLSLIAAGSKGPTQKQLLSFLKAKSADHLNSFASELVAVVLADGSSVGGPKLSFANGLWVDKSLPLKSSFKQVVDTNYKAATVLADFKSKSVEVTNEVNAWAEKETTGLIKEVLPPGSVDATTRLIFANALYFKGSWTEKFYTSKTKDHDFYLLTGTSIQVPFMTSKKKQTIRAFDGFKVLGLPYLQGEDKRQFSMYLILPDAHDGLAAVIKKVGKPNFLHRHIPHQKVEVGEFRIPKFKFSFGFEASKALKKLGVVLPFSGEGGGLTEMVDSVEGGNLYVSGMIHKSFIEVNEEGTEAAAVTVTTMETMGMSWNENIDFVADHPFLFLIRENMTGMVMFVGQVLNPSTI